MSNLVSGAILVLSISLASAESTLAQGTYDEKNELDFAQRLFNDSSYANAAEAYRKFIINFPTSDRQPDAMLKLGQAYFRSDQFREAVGAFQKFTDNYPNRLETAEAMRTNAQALLQLEEYTKAGTAFQDVHTAFPGGEYAAQDLLSAGNSFHDGDALAEAETAFRTLITKYPQSPLFQESTYNLGLVFLDAGRSEEALARFRSITEFSGVTERKSDAYLQMGNVALIQDDLEQAESIFAQLRKRFPKSASAETSYLVVGQWFADRNSWQKTAEIFEKSLLALPRNERRQQAFLGLAHAYRMLGKSNQALAKYTEFLKAYPTSPFLAQARLGFGRSFADLKNFRNALDAFKRLQEEFPDAGVSIQAHNDIGDIWRKLGTTQKALNAYRTYIEKVEDSDLKDSARLRIAEIYENELRWFDLAIQIYHDLIDRGLNAVTPSPHTSEAQFRLAGAYELTGDTNLATREYGTYIRKFPDGPLANEAETRIQYLEEFAPVEATQNRLVDILAQLPSIEKNPLAQFQLGSFLFKQRDYQGAADRLEAAISDDSTLVFLPEATYLLGNTYLKLAKKATLQGNPVAAATSWEVKGLAQHELVVSRYPNSAWADDARLALIETKSLAIEPDSIRSRFLLEAFESFQRTYPESDQIAFARIRIADAHLLANQSMPSRVSDALKSYRSVVADFPESIIRERAVYGIGVCLARQKQYRQAEEALRTFLFDYPNSNLAAKAQFQMGLILLGREYFSSAADEFSELLATPLSLELERSSRALLAESYFRMEDYPKAIQIDEGLLKRGATPPLLRRLARSYALSGQDEKAIQTYTSFLRMFSSASDADSIALTRAERLTYLGLTAEALSAFQEFSKKFPNSSLLNESNRARADILFQEEEYAEALKVYSQMPPNARSESVAGREILSLFRLKRIKEAEKAEGQFKKTYKSATEWTTLFEVEKGKYYLLIRDPKKGRQKFESIIKKYPSSQAMAEASYYLIQAYHDEGPDKDGKNDEYLEALISFVRNHSDNRNWTHANIELAEHYEQNEEYANAARSYQKALENGLQPEERLTILSKLLKNHRSLKLYPTAIGYARQIVQEFPHHAVAVETRMDLGNMLRLKGDFRESILELIPLLKLVEKDDDWSSVQFNIGESYYEMRDYESAKTEYLKVVYNARGSTNWIASAQYRIADCFVGEGNYQQAIESLKEIQTRFGANSSFGLAAGKRIVELQDRSNGSRFTPPGR